MVVFFFYAFAPRRRDALVNGGLTVMGMAWVTGTVAFAMPIIASENYRVLVFALVAATVAMDVGAYGFGQGLGFGADGAGAVAQQVDRGPRRRSGAGDRRVASPSGS